MRLTFLLALVALAATPAMALTSEPLEIEDLAAKRKLATEWMEYMLGRWNVTVEMANSDLLAPPPFVTEVKQYGKSIAWSHHGECEVLFWLSSHLQLVHYRCNQEDLLAQLAIEDEQQSLRQYPYRIESWLKHRQKTNNNTSYAAVGYSKISSSKVTGMLLNSDTQVNAQLMKTTSGFVAIRDCPTTRGGKVSRVRYTYTRLEDDGDIAPVAVEVSAKESVAKEWLKYMEGYWDVEGWYKGWDGDGVGSTERVEARLLGNLLIRKRRQQRWPISNEMTPLPTVVIYWSAKRDSLVEYSVTSGIADRLAKEGGQGYLARNPEVIPTRMFREHFTPYVYADITKDRMVRQEHVTSGTSLVLRKTKGGFLIEPADGDTRRETFNKFEAKMPMWWFRTVWRKRTDAWPKWDALE